MASGSNKAKGTIFQVTLFRLSYVGVGLLTATGVQFFMTMKSGTGMLIGIFGFTLIHVLRNSLKSP